MQKHTIQTITLVTIILAAAFSRIIPHMPNFSPLGAIAVFAAAHFADRRLSLVIPIAATWLSDLFLNNVIYAQAGQGFAWSYPGFYWQYAAYGIIALLSLGVFRRGLTVTKIISTSVVSGVAFFALSNFGVWFSSDLYPHNLSGLLACYAAALPFYQGTVLGDAVYGIALFGGFFLSQRYFPVLQPARELP
ncbi:MAG: DUF6580 family putative transport protein [Turneriella sp.]